MYVEELPIRYLKQTGCMVSNMAVTLMVPVEDLKGSPA